MADQLMNQLNDIKDIAERTLWESSGHFPMPVFDEKKESFRSFAQRLNDYLNARQATLVDAYRMIPLTLRGAAREVFDRLPADVQQGRHGWIELLRQIQRGTYTEEKKQEAQIQLATEKQGSRTVEAYAKSCQELAMKAFPEDIAAMEAVLLSTFLNGLKPNIKSQVRRQRPQNFIDAKSAAIHEESIQRMDANDQALRDAINSLTEKINYLNTNNRTGQERRWEGESFYRSRSRSIDSDDYLGERRHDRSPRRHQSRKDRHPSREDRHYNSRGDHDQSREDHDQSREDRYYSREDLPYGEPYNNDNREGYHTGGSGQSRENWNEGYNGNHGNRGYRGGNNDNRNFVYPEVNAIFDPMVAP